MRFPDFSFSLWPHAFRLADGVVSCRVLLTFGLF